MKNGFTHVKDGFTHVKNGFTHVKNGFTHVKNGFTYVNNILYIRQQHSLDRWWSLPTRCILCLWRAGLEQGVSTPSLEGRIGTWCKYSVFGGQDWNKV